MPHSVGPCLWLNASRGIKRVSRLKVPVNELFNRLTDREIHERIKKKPLDVGADRIARTAHAALQWLDEIAKTRGAPIPLAWEPFSKGVQAIEVYPAATLCLRGYPDSGYKGNGAKEKASLGVRKEILSKLKNDLEFDCDLSSAEQCADILDAVLCVLAGKDFLCGQSKAPSSDMEAVQKKKAGFGRRRSTKADADDDNPAAANKCAAYSLRYRIV